MKTRLRTSSTDQSSKIPHIIRNTRVQPTTSSVAIQSQVAPSLGTLVTFRTIRRRLAEGHLGSWCPLCVRAALNAHPSTPLLRVVPRTKKLGCSGMEPGRL
ncbi:HTH_Tnp_Tc3_2 domain-containing protein [Trichonephila clavipes]|nr:HTH_Tnp_Tc3_2 domain-containing protein [Trichonephila clavipes]